MGQTYVGAKEKLLYRKLGAAPVARQLLARHYEGRFANNRWQNLFRGVYGSFAEASASVPRTRPVGYDNADSASMYRERLERPYPHDYPVLLWLERALRGGARRLFEFGGHVGVAYYAYRSHLTLPEGFSWTVCDVPAVADAGRALAAERGASALSFTTRPEDADGADVFFASGSLQYVEWPLHALLRRLAAPPAHVLVNMTPLHPARSFVTLQSIGTAFCPYNVLQRDAFVKGLEGMGYRVVDAWDNPEKACDIPFHPAESLQGYAGMYLRRGG